MAKNSFYKQTNQEQLVEYRAKKKASTRERTNLRKLNPKTHDLQI
jgi:hypothetical protein